MQVVVGLGDQVGNAHFFQQHADQDAVPGILPNGHHRRVEILHTQRAQGLLVRRVQLQGLRHMGRDLVDQLLIAVHSQHFLSLGAQSPGHTGTEASQTEHQILLVLHDESPFSLYK